MKELVAIQTELKAPKSQYNQFGGYYYRSQEDILEALKPLLKKHKCFLTISDDIVLIGDRFYVKAIARLTNSEGQFVENTAFAREPERKKGMDEAQITGATSSYARKYALNGLFAIDDTKDADATNTHQEEDQAEEVVTADQVLELEALIEKAGVDRQKFMEYFGIQKLEDMPAKSYGPAIAILKKKLEKNGGEK